jgi:hypothetical protein
MKVLTRLRVDEVSCVTKGAGEGTRVVLMKRAADERAGFYHRLFRDLGKRREHVVRKGSKYGGHLRHRHGGDLDKATAMHWLLHDSHGAAVRDRLGLPAEEVADLLVAAATMQPTEKREASNMQDFHKTLRSVGEHGFSKMVQKYADSVRQPNETQAQAFTRVFSEDSEQGLTIRKFWQVSKGADLPSDARDEPSDDERDDGDDDTDALEELETLAREERRRNAGMSKAVAFAKIYTDPANARLAQRERMQHRPR